MPRFSTGARFLRAQRGPRPVRARLGAGRHRKGHPRPRQPHPCPAPRPRPASRPVTEGTRRSALLPGRKPKSRAGAHSGANEAGPPTAVVADGHRSHAVPDEGGQHRAPAAQLAGWHHRRQLAGWHHRGSFPVRVCRRQGVFTALFRRGRAEKKPNAPSTTEGGGFRGGRPAARPHGSLRGAFPVGNWPFGSIQPDVGSEINIF